MSDARYLLSSVEGNRQRLDGGAMFGNAPKPLWSRWIEPDERNRIPLACRAFLIHDRQTDQRILLDSGIGCFFEPKLRDRFGVDEEGHQLLVNLQRLGVEPAQIDTIVMSHLHFDHAGGLLSSWSETETFSLVFPSAEVFVGRTAWERANAPHPRDRASFIPELNRLLEKSGRLRLIEESGAHPLGEGFAITISDGHTPGLLLTEISTERGSVAFCADLVPGAPWMHVPITMGYDRFPELLVSEKLKFLEKCHARGSLLLFTHDPKYAATEIDVDSKARYVPRAPRESLVGLEL